MAINESNTVSYTVVTTKVTDGTVLYWTNDGTTVGADFFDANNSGSFTITNNQGSFTRTLTNDSLTEGSETVIIQIRTGSISGPIVATSNSLSINDTSLSPQYKLYV